MITYEQHTKIRALLDEWAQLCQLYTTIQTKGHMTVQVMGSAHHEFLDGALQEAKKTLKRKADNLKLALAAYDFDVSQLPALIDRVEVIRESTTN